MRIRHISLSDIVVIHRGNAIMRVLGSTTMNAAALLFLFLGIAAMGCTEEELMVFPTCPPYVLYPSNNLTENV